MLVFYLEREFVGENGYVVGVQDLLWVGERDDFFDNDGMLVREVVEKKASWESVKD